MAPAPDTRSSDTVENAEYKGSSMNDANKSAYAKTPIGYHHKDYIKPYKGCNTHFPFYLVQPDVDAWTARPEDIAISGFPKSGSSRLSAIVGMIQHNADPAYMESGEHLDRKIPFFEFCTPLNEKGPRSIDDLKKVQDGRIYFTHLGYDASPPSVLQHGAKIVYHIRNPKDVMVTLYYHFISRILSKYNGDLGDIVDAFVTDKIVYGPYFDHLASYWKMRDHPNVIIVSFEELTEKFCDTTRRIGQFLNKNLTEEELKTMERVCSFDAMKANPRTNRYDKHVAGIYDHNISPFLRSGVPGAWREHLTPEMNEKVNNWMAKNLAREDLKGLAERFPSTFTFH